ncbi:MAG: L-threonylcarbamoyladenylate synthase [Cyanobacteria bacterium J06621_11]
MPQVSPPVSLDEMVKALTTRPTLVSFPTDTVPALATRPAQAALIFAAKKRPPEKPLILMGASLEDLLPYISGDEKDFEVWRSHTQKHWPGQLTLVLPASDRTPSTLNPTQSGTIGIRVPNHPIALKLLAQTGPLATTSANLSGHPPLTTQADIAHTFPTALTLAPEAYIASHTSGTPSTVALWKNDSENDKWQILRQGKIRLQNSTTGA